jgi:hypothetical protein
MLVTITTSIILRFIGKFLNGITSFAAQPVRRRATAPYLSQVRSVEPATIARANIPPIVTPRITEFSISFATHQGFSCGVCPTPFCRDSH